MSREPAKNGSNYLWRKCVAKPFMRNGEEIAQRYLPVTLSLTVSAFIKQVALLVSNTKS